MPTTLAESPFDSRAWACQLRLSNSLCRLSNALVPSHPDHNIVCALSLKLPQAALLAGASPATAIIWGCSTGMLAIDLLLSTSAQSEMVIAIAIVAAAAVSTMTVWLAVRHAVVTKADETVQD